MKDHMIWVLIVSWGPWIFSEEEAAFQSEISRHHVKYTILRSIYNYELPNKKWTSIKRTRLHKIIQRQMKLWPCWLIWSSEMHIHSLETVLILEKEGYSYVFKFLINSNFNRKTCKFNSIHKITYFCTCILKVIRAKCP